MIDFTANRQVIVGEGAIRQIPDVLKWHRKNKVFLAVFDPAAPCVEEIKGILTAAGAEYVLYGEIVKEPDLAVIDAGAGLCAENECDSVLAVGGGSVIDAAKTIAMIAANGGVTEDYQLNGREVKEHPLLFIAVPTTAGTGAEATKVSVVYNPEKGFKKAIYHTSMIAQTAILDPVLTVGLPPRVTAATGMDAITHAIESYVSVNANDISRMYSMAALSLLAKNIATAYTEPGNLAAREAMLLGSFLAGCAISVGTCLAHIVGQPLGAIYGIPHGDACSIFLMPSMELNLEYALPQYVEIARTLGVDMNGKTDVEAARSGIAKLRRVAAQLEAPTKLTQYLPPDKIDVEAALDNIQTSMGHIKTNPRPVSRELFGQLIRSVL